MTDLHDLRRFALRDRNGQVLFTDYEARSVGETMAAYADHLYHVSVTNRNLNVHREVLRELGEVMHTHRGDFALAQQALDLDEAIADLGPAPEIPGGLRGLVARARLSGEQRGQIRRRESLATQRNVLRGTMPDAAEMVDAHQRLEEMTTRLYSEALIMRARDISDEIERQPDWLINTLGQRPDTPSLQKTWDETAERIASRRIDMRITEPETHGLAANQHELLGEIGRARVALGLEAPKPALADRELGLSLT